MLAAMIDGLSESGAREGAGATGVRRDEDDGDDDGVKNGANLASVMSIAEMCWGDVGLLLSMPRQGLGNSAIASVADDEQLERFEGVWAAMAITEPGIRLRLRPASRRPPCSTATTTSSTARRSSSPPVTAPTHVVVWATLDKDARPRRDQVVRGRRRARPGMKVERLEHKLGIRASDTATIRFEDCRVPAENLLGSPEVDVKQGFAGAMATFDNTRPLVAAMAVGCARASLDLTRDLLEQAGVEVDYDRPADTPVRRGRQVPADGGRLGGGAPADPAGGLDGRQPQAQLARGLDGQGQGRPGRLRHHAAAASSCAASVGYSETELLEKWARDSKILDIFEGTQQIQQLIVARRMLGLSSAELK